MNGFAGGMNDRSDDAFVVIMKQNQSLEQLYNMSNPIIALRKNEDLSKILIKYMFLKNNKNENVSLVNTNKHSTALLKLFFNQANAAIVSKKTFDFANELNPQIGKQLKIVYTSKVSSELFGYFRKGFDDTLRKIVTDLALKIVNSSRGEQLLLIFKTDSIVRVKVDDLKPTEELYHKYLELKKRQK